MDRKNKSPRSVTESVSRLVPCEGIDDALLRRDKVSIPVNPVIHAALRAIYPAGRHTISFVISITTFNVLQVTSALLFHGL
ncbi:MAG: hypothetical protein NTZ24_02010 [Deltaproteobacteria bacterium]|nr:hypothetical protein [Deltaproteobacteria bacterium]